MRIYPLRYPGVFLELPLPASQELNVLLSLAEGALIDAAIALDLFESEPDPTLPHEYWMRVRFVHAHSFLHAIDRAGKLLHAIAEQPGLPPVVAQVCAKFADAFPTVAELRNTTQHVEDRARGLAKFKKPLQLQPIDNQLLRSPGGALVLDALNGSEFGSTMADGHYGVIGVTDATLTKLQALLQELLSALPWKPGDPRESPNPPRTAPEIPEWVRKHFEAEAKLGTPEKP